MNEVSGKLRNLLENFCVEFLWLFYNLLSFTFAVVLNSKSLKFTKYTLLSKSIRIT